MEEQGSAAAGACLAVLRCSGCSGGSGGEVVGDSSGEAGPDSSNHDGRRWPAKEEAHAAERLSGGEDTAEMGRGEAVAGSEWVGEEDD